MEDRGYFKNIFKDSRQMLNNNILLFLYNLFPFIFIKRDKSLQKATVKLENQLEKFIKKINAEIIIKNDKYIKLEYSKKNFENIMDFVRYQNKIYAGDIIEGILIHTFSLAFQSDKDNTFGKYIFSNIYKLKDQSNFDIVQMFKEALFIPDELKNIKSLLLKDAQWEDSIENDLISEAQKNCVIYNLLIRIFVEKYISIKDEKRNNLTIYYINRGRTDNQKISEIIYNGLKEKSVTILDKDITSNSIMKLSSNIFFPDSFGKIPRIPLKIIRSFLIEVFIYYQNKNSPLMKYIIKDEENNYEYIPFIYDLRGACVEGRFAYIILSPIRIEPRIERIILSQNNLRECGMYEIGKIVIFNKNVKVIECNTSLLRTNYIEYLNCSLGLFDNYAVESLNISFNYLKDNSEEYIPKLITHFKGLKTLNFTANEFKRGLATFFVVLKNLYRKNESILENLIINKCLLDDSSYYELGELLKSRYCKLKKLFINYNTMPPDVNFLKKLKKNKSLTEIYLNKNEIGNKDTNDIIRIISNTKIRHLYLFKNKFSNNNDFLRILYRTKLIKREDEFYDKNDGPFLMNLDISNNELYPKNSSHMILLKKFMTEMTLYCLDISHILYGINPEKKTSTSDNLNYRKKVEEIKKYLEDDKKKYIKTLREIRVNSVDIRRNKHLENDEKITNIVKDKQEQIDKILSDKNSIYPVFLRKEIANFKENKEYEDKLVNYLVLKRSEKKLVELEEIRRDKKLIII